MDKLYFRDKNEGCLEYRQEIFCDCENQEFCITTEHELPYIQEQEILAPVFISTTLGSERFFKSKIQKNTSKINGKVFIFINRPFREGDIFKTNENPTLYYIFKSLGRDNNNFKYQIKRVDKESIIYLDINNLKSNRNIYFKGYFK